MTAVWVLVRDIVRRRWPALAALAILIGLTGGVVLTAAAGARRTATAYPRLLVWAHAAQLDVSPLGSNSATPDGTGTTGYYAALRRLPQVAYMSTAALLAMGLPQAHGGADLNLNVIGSMDVDPEAAADRVRLLTGAIFNSADPGEAMVDRQLASREHLHPGSTLHLLGIRGDLSDNPDVAHPVPLTFRVTAIVAFDDQVVPSGPVYAEPRVLLTRAFSMSPAAAPFKAGEYAGISLRAGASLPGLETAATALARRYPDAAQVTVISLRANQDATERAIGPQVIALAMFAGLAGLVMLASIGQLLGRQIALNAAEFPILRALGLPPRRLVAVSLLATVLVTGTGAAIAVVVAIVASPLMPIGPARLAEPSPGVEINLAILGAGFAALAVLPLALAGPAAWRASRQAMGPLGVADPPAAASWTAVRMRRIGLVAAAIGIRMAFEPGHGRTAVPVRSALTGTMVAITAVVATLVFGTSMMTLVDSPHLYGQNWTVKVDVQQPTITLAQVRSVASGLRGVAGYAAGNFGEVRLAGTQTPAIGVDTVSGQGFITLLRGREPDRPDEIALGAGTMRAHGWRLGQRIPAAAVPEPNGQPGQAAMMQIVGEVVLPAFSEGGFAATDLGQGAEVMASLLSSPYQPTGCTGELTCYTFILIRYQPGTSLPAALRQLQSVLTAHGCGPGCATISTRQQPAAIVDYASVRSTPLALSVLLALLAVGALAHVLLTSVRRRSRDLAVLKTLGLVRAQVLRIVTWQATAMAVTALLVGVPAGLLAGRWAWALFANSAGVSPTARVPVFVVLVLPVTLGAAILIAARPGVQASRIRPAIVLRRD